MISEGPFQNIIAVDAEGAPDAFAFSRGYSRFGSDGPPHISSFSTRTGDVAAGPVNISGVDFLDAYSCQAIEGMAAILLSIGAQLSVWVYDAYCNFRGSVILTSNFQGGRPYMMQISEKDVACVTEDTIYFVRPTNPCFGNVIGPCIEPTVINTINGFETESHEIVDPDNREITYSARTMWGVYEAEFIPDGNGGIWGVVKIGHTYCIGDNCSSDDTPIADVWAWANITKGGSTSATVFVYGYVLDESGAEDLDIIPVFHGKSSYEIAYYVKDGYTEKLYKGFQGNFIADADFYGRPRPVTDNIFAGSVYFNNKIKSIVNGPDFESIYFDSEPTCGDPFGGYVGILGVDLGFVAPFRYYGTRGSLPFQPQFNVRTENQVSPDNGGPTAVYRGGRHPWMIDYTGDLPFDEDEGDRA